MKKSIFILSLILIAFLGVSPVFAGMSGPSQTGIQIQNISQGSSASVDFSLYPQAGGAAVPIPVSPNPILPKGSANIWMPSQSVNTGSYSGVLSSGSPLGAIIRTDWTSTGGAAIYQTKDPSMDVTLPLVTYQYTNQTSDFTIQNTDTTNDVTDIAITLYQNGVSAPFRTMTNQAITKGASKTYHVTDFTPAVPAGFVGTLTVKSNTTPLIVQSYIDVAGSRGASGFEGVATSSAATTVFCPLIRANYAGDTGISVVNPSNSDITVTINFRDVSGHTYVQSLPVPKNSSGLAFQGVSGNSRTATTPKLPAGTGQTGSNPTPNLTGFYGSADIVSSTPIIAMVTDNTFGSGWSVQTQSSYVCQSAADAGTALALPLVRNHHMTSQQLTTGIQVQNTTANQLTVALELYNTDGTRRASSEPTPQVLKSHGSINFWGGNFINANNWVGSGVLRVTSGTGTIVAVVSDEGYGSVATDSANYTGMKMVP